MTAIQVEAIYDMLEDGINRYCPLRDIEVDNSTGMGEDIVEFGAGLGGFRPRGLHRWIRNDAARRYLKDATKMREYILAIWRRRIFQRVVVLA